MGRPWDKHIDSSELSALVPSSSETEQGRRLSSDEVRAAEGHVRVCADCSAKVSKYRQLVNLVVSEGAPPTADCPKDEDVDWHEVAAGLWPELKAMQLIMHAALCDHCGPLLRAATFLDNDPTPGEEELLAELKAPSRPAPVPRLRWSLPQGQFTKWLVPTLALLMIVGLLLSKRPVTSSTPLSGPKFAEFAVSTHRQRTRGNLALDLRTDSQQTLNEWFRAKSPFSLALPVSPAVPGEERPYRLEGARLVEVDGKSAAYIAYQMQTGPVSLIVTPDSVAVASGGVEVDSKNLRLHYTMVDGYKVVTWSVHGRTYALVSHEGNGTQRSCMICHSAIGDRDLSQTPTPLRDPVNAVEPARE